MIVVALWLGEGVGCNVLRKRVSSLVRLILMVRYSSKVVYQSVLVGKGEGLL